MTRTFARAVVAGIFASTTAAGPTTAGKRTVNVVPLPASLSTAMPPPIISQKRCVMARPRPVPPYLRVVDASACVNG